MYVLPQTRQNPRVVHPRRLRVKKSHAERKNLAEKTETGKRTDGIETIGREKIGAGTTDSDQVVVRKEEKRDGRNQSESLCVTVSTLVTSQIATENEHASRMKSERERWPDSTPSSITGSVVSRLLVSNSERLIFPLFHSELHQLELREEA